MNITKPIKILSLGTYFPEPISSEELEKTHQLPSGWAFRYSGVKQRHIATTEHNGIMGARAAEKALEKAGKTLADIDMLISASGTFDYPIPNQASIIKSELKDSHQYNFPAIDIDSTCLSFLTALDFAASILDGKKFKTILIVSSEISSKGTNPDNWETLTLFGDAAAAAIVSYETNSESSYIKNLQHTYSAGVYNTIVEGGGIRHPFRDQSYDKELHSFKMNGKQLLRMAKQKLPVFLEEFFNNTNESLDTIDAIIPHQASKVGLMLLPQLFPISSEKIHTTLETHGNCIAASIPLTLSLAVDSKQINRGDKCLLIGTSAGFSIGATLLHF